MRSSVALVCRPGSTWLSAHIRLAEPVALTPSVFVSPVVVAQLASFAAGSFTATEPQLVAKVATVFKPRSIVTASKLAVSAAVTAITLEVITDTVVIQLIAATAELAERQESTTAAGTVERQSLAVATITQESASSIKQSVAANIPIVRPAKLAVELGSGLARIIRFVVSIAEQQLEVEAQSSQKKQVLVIVKQRPLSGIALAWELLYTGSQRS